MAGLEFSVSQNEPERTLKLVLNTDTIDNRTFEAAVDDRTLMELVVLRDAIHQRELELSRGDASAATTEALFDAGESLTEAVDAYVQAEYGDGEVDA